MFGEDPRNSLPRGTRLSGRYGSYHIKGEIGRGGTSLLYLAAMRSAAQREDGTDDVLVVLKELYPLFATRNGDQSVVVGATHRDEMAVMRQLIADEYTLYRSLQLQESRQLQTTYGYGDETSSVSQPLDFLMEAIECFEANETLYFSMKTYNGTTLQGLGDKLPSMSLKHMLSIIREASGALAALHQRGILHLDIKPNNLFITTNGSVKLLDLNAARKAHTITERVSFSYGFSPPGDEEPTEKTDVFHLCALINWMLLQNAGIQYRLPSQHIDLFSERIPCLRLQPYETVNALNRLLKVGLSHDPTQRPSSVVALDVQLEQLTVTAVGNKLDLTGLIMWIEQVANFSCHRKLAATEDWYACAIQEHIMAVLPSSPPFTVDETKRIIDHFQSIYFFRTRNDLAFASFSFVYRLLEAFPDHFPIDVQGRCKLLMRLHSSAMFVGNRHAEMQKYKDELCLCSPRFTDRLVLENALITDLEDWFRFSAAMEYGNKLLEELHYVQQRPVREGFFSKNPDATAADGEPEMKITSKIAQQYAYLGRYAEAKEWFLKALSISGISSENRTILVSYAYHAAIEMYGQDDWYLDLFTEEFGFESLPQLSGAQWVWDVLDRLETMQVEKSVNYHVYALLKTVWMLLRTNAIVLSLREIEKILSSRVIQRELERYTPSQQILKYYMLIAKQADLLEEYRSAAEHFDRTLSSNYPAERLVAAAAYTACMEEDKVWQETELYRSLIELCPDYPILEEYFGEDQDAWSTRDVLSLFRYLYA